MIETLDDTSSKRLRTARAYTARVRITMTATAPQINRDADAVGPLTSERELKRLSRSKGN